MKFRALFRFLSVLAAFFLTYKASATHFAGGDCYYDYSGQTPGDATKTRYTVYFVFYRDANGAAIPNNIDIGIYNAQTNTLYANQTLSNPARTNITQYAPNCNYPSPISYEKVVFTAVVDLTNGPGYYVSHANFNRNGGQIVNLTQGMNNFGIVLSVFIPPYTYRNNAPRFRALPVPYACINKPYVFNHDGYDPDGDSLVYSFEWPYGGFGTLGQGGGPGGLPSLNITTQVPVAKQQYFPTRPTMPGCSNTLSGYYPLVQYAGAYDFPNNQIPTAGGASALTINPATGELSFTPNALGGFVVAIEAKEYRVDRVKGTTTYLGSIRRDLQFVFGNTCSGNQAPIITPVNPITPAYPDSFTVSVGDNLCFSVNIFDPDFDSLFTTVSGDIFSNVAGFPPPYATMNSGNGQTFMTLNFCWNVTCAYARVAPYNIIVKAQDGICNVTQKTIFIKVVPKEIIIPPKLRCVSVTSPTSITINWQKTVSAATDFKRYNIYRNTNGGAFSLLTSLSNINSVSYTDNSVTGATTVNQYSYFIIPTNYCDEAGESSDTLTSILINMTNPGPTSLKGTWNPISTSTTGGFSPTYSVFEGSSSGWNASASQVSTALSYTKIGCNYTVRYKVTNTDALIGCVSQGYTNLFTVKDSISPSAPTMKNVSSNSSNKFVITWNKSDSMDTYRYLIYRSVAGGTYALIDSVLATGTATQSYTDNSSSATAAVYCYKVAARDTCSNLSAQTTAFCGVYLSGAGQQLRDSLNWTAFSGYTATPYLLQRLNGTTWTTIATTVGASNYIDSANIKCGTPISYRVIAVGSPDSSYSGILNLTPLDTVKPDKPAITNVTYTNNATAVVTFTHSVKASVNAYKVYVRTNTGSFALFNTFSKTTSPQSVTVTGLAANSNTYSFYVAALDSCSGLSSDSSSHFIPVHLRGSGGPMSSSLTFNGLIGYTPDSLILERYDSTTSRWVVVRRTLMPPMLYAQTDTITPTFCGQFFTYRVQMHKLGGTTYSVSSIISVSPQDTIKPIVVNTLSLSVTAPGSLTIGFRKSTSPRVNKYVIQLAVGNGAFTTIDTIRSNGSFIYNKTYTGYNTATNFHRLRVYAMDSCNGLLSPTVETHQCVRLQAWAGNLKVNLAWNAYLGFDPNFNYKVERWDPVGITWRLVGTTGGLSFVDTPLACNVSQIYRIRVNEIGGDGETSFSNEVTATPYDTIPPSAPTIKSVSVVSNGRVLVQWNSMATTDVDSVEIWRKYSNGSTWTKVATLGSDTFAFVTGINTLDSINCFRMVAIDSCANNRSVPGVEHRTVQLKGTAGNLSNTLNWSQYVTLPTGYYYQIEKLSGTSWSLVDTVPGSVTTFTDTALACNVPVDYRIRTYTSDLSIFSLSDTIRLTPFDTVSPAMPSINFASVIDNGKIHINWVKSTSRDVNRYEIWRKYTFGNWVLAATISDTNNYVLTGINTLDSGVCVSVRAVDSCANNKSPLCAPHCATQLKGVAQNLQNTLNWSVYSGGSFVQYQVIEHFSLGSWQTLDTVYSPTSTYTHAALPCKVPEYYRIANIDFTGSFVSYSDTIQLIPSDTIRPNEPQILFASVVRNGQIDLKWEKSSSDDVTSYEIWKKTPSTGFVYYATVGDTDEILITGLNTIDSINCFGVIAVDSCASNKSFITQVHCANQLTGEGQNLQNLLTWSAYSGNTYGTQDYIQVLNGSSWTTLDSIPYGVGSYVHSGLPCNIPVTYRIVTSDNREEYFPISDTITLTPFDTTTKIAPQIDYVTTVGQDSVKVSWQPSISNNVSKYYIYAGSGTLSLIDSVNAGSPLQYTFFAPTTTTSYCVEIAAVNSCNGAVGYRSLRHCTVLLTGKRVDCQKVYDLSWNAYNNWSNPVLNYKVYRKTTGGTYLLIATVSGTTYQYSDPTVMLRKGYCYKVVATETGLGTESVSFEICDTITPPLAPELVSASKVLTSPTSGQIELTWNSSASQAFASQYRIFYSPTSVGPFTQIATIPAAQTSYVHTGLNTASADHFYYLTLEDSCGNLSDSISVHKSMNLSLAGGQIVHTISWTPYQGIPLVRYEVQSLQSGVWNLIDTVAPTATTYRRYPAPCNYDVIYRVAAISASGIAYSDTDAIRAIDTIPANASDVQNATVVSDNNVLVTFRMADSLDIFAYSIRRSINGGPFSSVALIPHVSAGFIANYQDSVNTLRDQICYEVITLDSCLNATNSNVVCVSQLSSVGQNLQNTLTWTQFAGYPVQTYSVQEFDGTTWNTIGSVQGTDTTFVHAPINCNQTRAYRIRANENGGVRFSYSDTTQATPFDTIKPIAPVITLATVRSNGIVDLTWNASVSGDVRNYQVYTKTSGQSSWTLVASLGNVTSYTATGLNTLDSINCFRVLSIDTCANNQSDPGVDHCVIQLTGNPVNLGAQLNWSAYQGQAINKYFIDKMIAGSWTLLDSTTTTSYLELNQPCRVPQTYRVRGELSSGLVSFSDSIVLIPFDTIPPSQPVITSASVISNGSVKLTWPAGSTDIGNYEIYHKTAGVSTWTLFRTIGYDTVFTATGLNTADSVNCFSIVALDTCSSNRSPQSVEHCVIQLSGVTQNLQDSLNWTAYSTYAGSIMYYVQTLNAGTWTNIDSTISPVVSARHLNLPCNVPVTYRITAQLGSIYVQSDTLTLTPFDTVGPAAPSIAIVSVLNNSQIQVKFTQSASGDVNRYQVYLASRGGTYSLVKTGTASPSTTVLDTITVPGMTSSTSYCMYIKAVDSCANNLSVPSVPHCDIELKATAGNLSAQLKWTPYTGISLNAYRIERFNNNTGVWDFLVNAAGTDSSFTDNDPLIGCGQTYLYRVLGLSSANDTSYSDTVYVTPFDTVKPFAPVLTSAAVNPNGSVTLRWNASASPDVKFYEIWRAPFGSTTFTSIGQTTFATTYNDATAAVSGTIRWTYRIVAIDSCNTANRSVESNEHTTSDLFSRTGSCTPAIVLNWNPYPWFPNGGLRYQIWRSTNGGAYSKIDSVPFTDTTFTDFTVSVNGNYCYQIVPVSTAGIYAAATDTICSTPVIFPFPAPTTMAFATVVTTGTASGSAYVVWNKSLDTLSRRYVLYHSTTGVWPFTQIAILPTLNDTTFTHTGINTLGQIHYYSVRILDSCGRQNDSAVAIRTINATLVTGNNYNQVTWNPYSITPVTNYIIERSVAGGPLATYFTLSGTDTNYVDSNVSCGVGYSYRVKAMLNNTLISYSDSIYGVSIDTIPPDVPVFEYASVTSAATGTGSIELKWYAPPQRNRNGYKIYRSVNGAPFVIWQTVIDTTSGSKTIIDFPLNTLANTHAYQITSTDSCGNESPRSEIHRPVNLSVASVSEANNLSWTPYLGFDSTEYRIEKSINGGPFNLFAILRSPAVAYVDSAVKCDTIYNYRISARDLGNPTVIANGDTARTTGLDFTKPLAPVVVRATVTATNMVTGSVLVEWNPSVSKDVKHYVVMRKTPNGIWLQRALLGPVTAYTDYPANTVDSTYEYRVYAIDSCANLSSDTSIVHKDILLKATPNNESNDLVWTAYAGWAVKNYLVYRDGVLVATLPGTTLNYHDSALICTTYYEYVVRAIGNTLPELSNSNTSKSKPYDTNAPTAGYVETVTVMPDNKSIKIRVQPSTSFDAAQYQIVRREDGNIPTVISINIPGALSVASDYIDTFNIDVNKHYYDYALITFDYCGNQSVESNTGNSILLKATYNNFDVTLSWQKYRYWNGSVDRYELERTLDGTNWTQLTSTTDSFFTDRNIPGDGGQYCYRVKAYEGAGSWNQTSTSNKACVTPPAIIFIPTAFTPGYSLGLNDNFGPVGSFYTGMKMSIFNRWGEKVFESVDKNVLWDGRKDGKLVEQGLYIYLIEITDFNGKVIPYKGTVSVVH